MCSLYTRVKNTIYFVQYKSVVQNATKEAFNTQKKKKGRIYRRVHTTRASLYCQALKLNAHRVVL